MASRDPHPSYPGFARWKGILLGFFVGLLQAGGIQLRAAVVLLDQRGGFDDYHNLATGVGFADFRDLIEEEGHRIVHGARFDDHGDLLEATALVLLQPYSEAQAYTAEEVAALGQFVDGGGRLLVVAEAGTGSRASYLNVLSERLGVTFASSASEAVGATVSFPGSHDLFKNVSSVAVDYQRRVSVMNPALDPTPASGPADFVAISGGSVFLGDSSLLMNMDSFGDSGLDAADNRIFARNALAYLTSIPEPSMMMATAIGLAGMAIIVEARRRH